MKGNYIGGGSFCVVKEGVYGSPPTRYTSLMSTRNEFRTHGTTGTAACKHRDLSVCDECADSPHVFPCAGAHFVVPAGLTREECVRVIQEAS